MRIVCVTIDSHDLAALAEFWNGPDVEPHYRNWVLSDPEGNEFCLGGGAWPEGVDAPSEVPLIHP